MSEKNYRPRILFLLFVSVVINYLDRTNISVAADDLSKDLGLSSIQLGLIFSAFGWTYSTLQIPGGMVADRFKPKYLYTALFIFWSVVTLFQAGAESFVMLVILRMIIGVFEAPSFPLNNIIVTNWFPEKQRASAISIYTSGQFIGLAFLFPILTWVQQQSGWRNLFILSGVIGLLWAGVWYLLYKEAPDSPQSKQPKKESKKITWGELQSAFNNRKLLGLYLTQFCMGSVTIFFLTWFPSYLSKYRGIELSKSGILGSLPFIFAFLGVLTAGFSSDFLRKKNYSIEWARKIPVVTGLLLSMIIVGANYTNSTNVAVTFLCVSFFGNGLASINWVFVSLLAPPQSRGLVGGAFNFIGSSSSVVIPIVIGVLAQNGNFEPALAFISLLSLLGLISLIFIVGKISPQHENH